MICTACSEVQLLNWLGRYEFKLTVEGEKVRVKLLPFYLNYYYVKEDIP